MAYSGVAECTTLQGMSDYYSIIAKAVHALSPNTGEARRRLYDRARGALNGEMRNAQLSLDQSEILTARMALEAAITKVEAELARAEAPPRAAVVGKAPARSATPAEEKGRGPLTKLWSQMFGRNGHRIDAPPSRREPGPRPAPRAPAPAAKPRAAKPLAAKFPAAATHPAKGRDTWLTDLLARASREEDEDEAMAPPKVRRIR
jgi:hypothetical protein